MKKNKQMNQTAASLMLIFFFVFLVIGGRFIYIQATGKANNVSLTEWANEKRDTTITLPASRGKIYDHSGMTLAYNRPMYRVYAILNPEYSKNRATPQHVEDPEMTAEKLARYLNMEKKEIQHLLENGIKEERFQVEFGKKGKNLSKEKMEKINKEQIPGIFFIEDTVRYYPNGLFASNILGFTKIDEKTQNQVGVTGIEKEKDKLLRGTDGYVHYQRDKYNQKLLKPNETVKKAENGDDIYLTIDQKVQTILDDAMSQVDEQYDPERITAIVLNAKTGEVVAMSNRPSFNPNNPDKVENWYNDVISTPFEPGSTMKIFTWAAAIEEGVYKGEALFKSGKYIINPKVRAVNDHNAGVGWGEITFDEGFHRSSNVAASKLVWEDMGTEIFMDYLEKFDFDKKTGIDLPNEAAGKILYDWPAEKLTTSFGQGSTLTPIQQVKAATSFANKGQMLQPFVIKKIVDPNDGTVILENERKVVGTPISEKTVKQMIELMDGVVNGDKGTGRAYQLESYTAIGKTGTAQIPDPESGGYLTGRENNNYTFLGMAPKDDPELIMHISVKQPKLKDADAGTDPVSYIFKNVMENGLHYLKIEPDKNKDKHNVKLMKIPTFKDNSTKDVIKRFEKLKANVTIVGNGKKIVHANVEEGDHVSPSQHIILLTDEPTMPSVKGWASREVVTLGTMLEMEVTLKGTGFVETQSIKEGATLKKDMTLTVQLKP